MNQVNSILAWGDCLDQGGELMHSERASDQTFTGWGKGEKDRGTISIPYRIGGGGAKDVPLSDAEVVTVS